MELTVSLPCTAKAYAWLAGKYGDSFLLNESESDFLFIISQLERNHRRYDNRISADRYTHSIQIKISYQMYEQYGGDFSLTSIQRINGYLEKQINERLYPSIDLCLKYLPKKRGIIKETILTFLDQNNLDPDIINYEAIKKHYWRLRSKKSA
jgi:hypothetical protein